MTVTATRADETKPATFTNLSREQIEELYYAQEVPILLANTPSVYAYSEPGNDIGYAYLRVRGFDQRRIAVTINGVPLNDAESHNVFWVDLPNFPGFVEDIQVQRGAGTSMLSGNPTGGVLNFETQRLTPGERFGYELGFGSYGTSKIAASWVSDTIGDDWVLGVQLSRIGTDGYRDDTWVRMGSAFITAQRIREDSLLRINVYGGLEESHLAYYAASREEVQQNPRINPLSGGPTDLDHFFQPHFEVIHEWKPSDKLEIANTFYAFLGDGYYDQYSDSKSFSSVRLPDWDVDGDGTVDSRGEIFRKRQVEEWDYGWNPRVTLDHGSGSFSVGANLRFHTADHWGEAWGDVAPGTPSDYRYYDYHVDKEMLTFYVQEEWHPTDRLDVVAGLQYVDVSWDLGDDEVTGYRYDIGYDWFAPRLAFGYQIAPRWHGMVSVAQSRREPTVSSLFNLQDTDSVPAFGVIGEDGTLSQPLVREERLTDYEFGLEYRSAPFGIKLTLFDMKFKDEHVALGQLNDLGEPITANAPRTVHRGVELEWRAALAPRWELLGNASVIDAEHKEFSVFAWDDDLGELVEVDYAGNAVAQSPERLARMALVYKPDWGRVEFGGFHVGRIYLDNTETRSLSIEPYEVFHLDARWDGPFGMDKAFSLRGRIINLFDESYETSGYTWGPYAYVFPGAERHFYLSLGYRPR